MIKNYRQAIIKRIIEENVVETQDELTKLLLDHDIKATQATVSRDVKDMMLVKIPLGKGRCRYAFPRNDRLIYSRGRAARLMQDSLLSTGCSENLLVLKTVPGSAAAVATLLDNIRFPEILGTVAGHDTVLVVAVARDKIEELKQKIESLAYGEDEEAGEGDI